jgi:DNA-binding GntR family transcriptional regulator
MQTSRVPVREALMQLEGEGLVVRQPNRGTFVAELTEKMLREIASFRILVEGFAAAQVAKRLTPDNFRHLEKLVKEMRDAAKDEDYPRLLWRDYQFHEHIVRAAGNDLLEEAWRTHGRVRLYLSTTNLVYSDRRSVAESHASLVDVLRCRDPERARGAMAKHIERPLERSTKALSATKR